MTRSILTSLTIILTSAAIQPLLGQNVLPGDLRINGKTVWEAFEPQRQVLQKSSAVIYTDDRARIMKIYGIIVSEDGYILTKASEIEGSSSLSLRIGSDIYREVQVVDVDPQWDVAMLKIKPTTPLIPVEISDQSDVPQGSWVISNGSTSRSNRRVKVGIVGAHSRGVAVDNGVMLGVVLGEDSDNGLEIKELSKDGGAEQAGLQKGDILKSVEGQPMLEREELLKAVQDKKAGDKLAVEVARDGEMMKFEIELKARPGGPKRPSRNDQMGGGAKALSERSSDFPRILQHDTPVSKDRIGGPLLNLDGECVGMNIARNSRVATYAIPARELSEIIARLKK
ncbi:trypsin-like peptidase domain-containing protein [Verrucomicrobiaceae bacterium R5-34]|nr:trypsin-like peptidase domain-containing protein [Verrucomicrobiaceae bacterium R5-34]